METGDRKGDRAGTETASPLATLETDERLLEEVREVAQRITNRVRRVTEDSSDEQAANNGSPP